jgi:hypothetical protein
MQLVTAIHGDLDGVVDQRRGYRRTGETEPFPYDDLSVGVPLRDDLLLVVLRKSLQGFTSC